MIHKTLIYSTNNGIWGGGQIYIEQLCNYMNNRGTETYILTYTPDSFDCPTKKMKIAHPKWRRLSASIAIAKAYSKEGYKTVILNDLAALWLAPIFKFYGFTVISLLHLYLQRRSENALGHSNIQYQLLKLSATFCNTIFSVNKNNQEVFGKDKVRFIGNYVPNWFFEVPKYGNTKQYDFIIIARLAKQKNIPLFLEILSKMNKKLGKEYSALIVGEGPEREEVDRIIFELGLKTNVKVMNWVERKELPCLYDKGKCFVISSYHEGFATTLLEAHARGVPAIVTKSSGFCGEFVDGYNASTGIVFEPDDLNDIHFYERLALLIENYESYEDLCLNKAKIFSEKNVLEPILQASLIQ